MPRTHAFQALLRNLFGLATISFDATERHPPVWAAVLGGAGLGLVWGLAARLWMRLISTHPEFTLGGTAAILIIATLFGTFAGLAFAARRRGWRGWGHYLPRSLAVFFFLPLGIAGGAPLMITVLLATLGATGQVVFGAWVLAAFALFWEANGGPLVLAVLMPIVALALTVWKWLRPRWYTQPRLLWLDTWLNRIVRTLLLLLAAFGFGFIAWEVASGKPGWLAPLNVLFYLFLLYSLFLALRVGLAPRASAASLAASPPNPEQGPRARGELA